MKPTITSRDALAFVLILAFAFVLVALMFRGVPEGSRELFAALAGSLGTLLATVVKFYFPSDQSSEAKNATISAQAHALVQSTGPGGDNRPPSPPASAP
jgi:hypothetical protein